MFDATEWLRGICTVASLCAIGGVAGAQCPEWSSGFGVDGTNHSIFALTTFDDGNGPELYACGNFDHAGGLPVKAIAVWNGSQWSAIAPAYLTDIVYTMTAHDDGSGAALFIAGEAGRVYKWT